VADLLRATRARGRGTSWTVIGAGHGGLAMAGHLALLGYAVTLYNRTDASLDAVRWHGGIRVEGAVDGFGPVRRATSSMEEALDGADVVMIVAPSTAHRPLAGAMAPYVRRGQLIVLNPGRTGGTLEVEAVFRAEGVRVPHLVGEAQTFLYASRALSRWEARIFRIKNSVPVATLPSHLIPEALAILREPFPQFTAGTDVLATSLENIGAVFHPALAIMNAGWIEATHGDFEFYLDGVTPAVARILERVDAERCAVAAALGVRSMTAREWLYLSYGSVGGDLQEAVASTEGYRGIRAPEGIAHRYIGEDVPMSLVPMASLGAMLGVATPVIDTMIRLGSLLHAVDFRAVGRTVESLGLAGLTVRQIRALVTGSGRRRPRGVGR
jgi:opine dehydrogenase